MQKVAGAQTYAQTGAIWSIAFYCASLKGGNWTYRWKTWILSLGMQKPDIWSTSRFFEPQHSEHSYWDKEKTERIFDVFIEQRRANIHQICEHFIHDFPSSEFKSQKLDIWAYITLLSIESRSQTSGQSYAVLNLSMLGVVVVFEKKNTRWDI